MNARASHAAIGTLLDSRENKTILITRQDKTREGRRREEERKEE